MGTKQETGVDRKSPTDGAEIERDGIEERGGTYNRPFHFEEIILPPPLNETHQPLCSIFFLNTCSSLAQEGDSPKNSELATGSDILNQSGFHE